MGLKMACTSCGGASSVTESRVWLGETWRRRKCAGCGRSFVTVERRTTASMPSKTRKIAP